MKSITGWILTMASLVIFAWVGFHTIYSLGETFFTDKTGGHQFTSLLKAIRDALIGGAIGAVLQRLGHMLIHHEEFPYEAITHRRIAEIYEKENLATRPLVRKGKPSRYAETANADLANIYQNMDRVSHPETFEDLMLTIKERVEKPFAKTKKS